VGFVHFTAQDQQPSATAMKHIVPIALALIPLAAVVSACVVCP